jgi:hypothetical protein
LLVVASFLVAGTESAFATGLTSAYPPPAVGLEESTSAVCPGSSLTVTGQGWEPGHEVTLTLMPGAVPLGTIVTDSAGSFSLVVTIPSNTSPGQYEKVASGPSGANPAQTLTLTGQLTVESCPAPVPQVSHPLPFTGFGARAWLVASLAFILAGSALVFQTRKRRHRHAA